jgi:hypothetical protein
MGLSIDELTENSPALMRNNAKDVKLVKIRQLESKGGYPIVAANSSTPKSRRKRQHKTWFVGKDYELPLHLQDQVLAQCSCENYMYMFEVANHSHGAAQIIYSNGEHPVITNPSLSPGLCLSGRMLLITPEGSKRVETTLPGNYVIGTGGYQPVSSVALVTKEGYVVTVEFNNRATLVLTLDHKVLVTTMSDIKAVEKVILCSYLKSFDMETYGFGYPDCDIPYLQYKPLREVTKDDYFFYYRGTDIRGDLNFKPKVDDYELVSIGSMSNVTIEPVYDIELAGGHFMANNIVVRNCKHLYRLAQVIRQRGY